MRFFVVLAALPALFGCATRPAPAPEPPARITLYGFKVLPAGSSRPTSSVSLVTIESSIEVTADYALGHFEPGNDRITVVIDRAGEAPRRLKEFPVTLGRGRLNMKVFGSELLAAGLKGPFGMHLQLERMGSGSQLQTLGASDPVPMEVDPTSGRSDAKLIPPSIGKGQLVSDMVNDPRYRPRVPKSLATAGSVYWGLFKICVDTDGVVHSVALLKSAHVDVDQQWISLLRTLEHHPYSIGGKVVPFCYPMRLEVRVQ